MALDTVSIEGRTSRKNPQFTFFKVRGLQSHKWIQICTNTDYALSLLHLEPLLIQPQVLPYPTRHEGAFNERSHCL
jgi:hypothetical protein